MKKIKSSDIKIKIKFKTRDKKLNYNTYEFKKSFLDNINRLMVPIANEIRKRNFIIVVYFSNHYPTIGIHLYDNKYNKIGYLKVNDFVEDDIDINLATFLFENKQTFLQLLIYKVILDTFEAPRDSYIPILRLNKFRKDMLHHLLLLKNANLLSRINGNTFDVDRGDDFFFELNFDIRDETVWWLTYYSEINKKEFSGESESRFMKDFSISTFIDVLAECRILYDNATKEELKKLPFKDTFDMLRLLNY